MTSAELARRVFSIVERKIASEKSSLEFEMAYQMRVASEKIRFAIRAIDSACPNQTNEASLQLLDALTRLEQLDRRFQDRSRTGPIPDGHAAPSSTEEMPKMRQQVAS
jgi:hypothetical protein